MQPLSDPSPSPGLQKAPETDQAKGQQTGIQAVLALPEFRKLWLGQVFSQLAGHLVEGLNRWDTHTHTLWPLQNILKLLPSFPVLFGSGSKLYPYSGPFVDPYSEFGSGSTHVKIA